MTQKYTSKDTSINKDKLPGSTKLIDWETYRGKNVLDFGGGKFDNLKEYLKEQYDINLYISDKYNRTNDENKAAWNCNPALVVCNNVLNTIAEDDVLYNIIACMHIYKTPAIYYIYEGDKSGVGRQTGVDQYQRNELTKDYKRHFDKANIEVTIKGRLIITQ